MSCGGPRTAALPIDIAHMPKERTIGLKPIFGFHRSEPNNLSAALLYKDQVPGLHSVRKIETLVCVYKRLRLSRNLVQSRLDGFCALIQIQVFNAVPSDCRNSCVTKFVPIGRFGTRRV